ncbi:MAG: DEAD/DEAH box helicase, partial [Candidatus Hodarchaeales archaeon]
MLIESLSLSNEIKNIIIKKDNIKELYPPQADAINQGLLEGTNLVISIPTAAGKTLLAELAALKHTLEQSGKVIYLCPLRALAAEKFKSFKRFQDLGVRVAITSGDYDSKDHYLPTYDIIISTNEKFDALLRHKVSWIEEEVSLVIIDECHLLNDNHRGPTLEILLARLLMGNPHLQIIALSATIGNSEDLAEWLNAELVESNWRPVPLREGVYYDNYITFSDYSKRDVNTKGKDPLLNIALDSFRAKEQTLIFVPSRRIAVSTAKKIGVSLDSHLNPNQKNLLAARAAKLTRSVSDPLSKQLVEIMKTGAAFHHAGLNSEQRTIIEESFKEGLIHILCATPTLCLSQDTMVWQRNHQTKISDLDRSNEVFALKDNRLIPIQHDSITSMNNSKPLIKITSVSGYTIKVTQNHRMLIKRNGHKMTLEARDLLKTDKIATVGRLELKGTNKLVIKDFIKENLDKAPNIEIDPEICYFIGLMLGDGYSGGGMKQNSIIYKGTPCIVNKNKGILDYCQNIGKKLSISTRRAKDYYGTPVLHLGKNKWFREFLVRSGVEQSTRKHISRKFFDINRDNVVALLRGLFDSDGFIQKGRSISFGNSSKILIKQVQYLLLRFGIVCRLRTRKGSTMKIYDKKYKTLPSYTLIISQKNCIIKFQKEISFGVERKRIAAHQLVDKIQSNIHYISCPSCQYRIYKDLFQGRSDKQKTWGEQKKQVITLLGERGELGSRVIAEELGFEPKKDELRLNHHYELIEKRKRGKISKTEWFWSLNEIGNWVYHHIKDNNKMDSIFTSSTCPLCESSLRKKIRKGWRDSDFDGDIFWDKIRAIKQIEIEPIVYDVSLPNHIKTDHMFVANGFIVHNSAGINLPAKRVVISSVYRYSLEQGSYPIKTLEYKQMCLVENTKILTSSREKNI